MRIIVTAGPTRQHLDAVRFITNASSGRMGCAVAASAVRAGHEVTLLLGPVAVPAPGGCEVVPFVTVADLAAALAERFAACDALVMVAAVGDFRPEQVHRGKLARGGGAVAVRLVPTEDVLASLAARKRGDQLVVAFAAEAGPDEQIEAKARREMRAKGADFVVVNTPAAMAAESSRACVLAAGEVLLGWADRPKEALAEEVVRLIGDWRGRPGR